jgi:hypothetical protein
MFPGCEAKFTAKSSLYVHVKKHKSPANKDTFVCPIENCNHKYLRKASLRHHMAKNHQAQPIDGKNKRFSPTTTSLIVFINFRILHNKSVTGK